jgi:hypothetical protein
MPTHNKPGNFSMDDKLKADINKKVDEAAPSRIVLEITSSQGVFQLSGISGGLIQARKIHS